MTRKLNLIYIENVLTNCAVLTQEVGQTVTNISEWIESWHTSTSISARIATACIVGSTIWATIANWTNTKCLILSVYSASTTIQTWVDGAWIFEMQKISFFLERNIKKLSLLTYFTVGSKKVGRTIASVSITIQQASSTVSTRIVCTWIHCNFKKGFKFKIQIY